jgi:hypothetical protein
VNKEGIGLAECDIEGVGTEPAVAVQVQPIQVPQPSQLGILSPIFASFGERPDCRPEARPTKA